MWRFGFSNLFLICILFSVSPAFAELDLALNAGYTSSGNAPYEITDDYAATGFQALFDNDPFTVWIPQEQQNTFLEIDLGKNAINAKLNLDRIVIEWGNSFPESVMVTAGPDSYTQTVLTNITISNPDVLTITQASSIQNLRKIRILFSSSDISIKSISIFAAKAEPIGQAPAISGEMNDNLYVITISESSLAHHYEVERTRGEDQVTFTTQSTTFEDLPHLSFNDTYKVRAVDFTGEASGWSNTIGNNTKYELQDNRVEIRGIAEAFSGYPWDTKTRNHLLHFIGNWQFTHFFYAPTKDSKRKENWRELYTEDEVARLQSAVSIAKAKGVSFVYCISPGKDLKPALTDELNTLVSKLTQLGNIGISSFALLLDDTESSVNSSLGESHANFVNLLNESLKEFIESPSLFYKGAIYKGTDDDFDSDQIAYLEELKNISQEVAIIWTGAEEYNESITSAELSNFAALVDHPILLWDNYPLNATDQSYFNHQAIQNRNEDLLTNEKLAGVTCSSTPETLASMFAIDSYSTLLLKPDTYNSADYESMRAGRAIDYDIADSDWNKLKYLFSEDSLFENTGTNSLEPLISEFITKIEIGTEEDIRNSASSLFDSIMESHRLIDRIANSENNLVRQQFLPFFSKMQNQLSATTLSINILQSKVFGQKDAFYKELEELENLKQLIDASTYNAADSVFSDIIELALNPDKPSFEARFAEAIFIQPVITSPNNYIRSNQSYYWDLGVNISPLATWETNIETPLDTSITNHLLSITTTSESDEINYDTQWLGISSSQGQAYVVKEAKVDICPAISSETESTLPLSSTLENKDGVYYLNQNGIIIPDASFNQYSKQDLSDNWKKKRMTLDHALSFSERNDNIIKLLEAESTGAILPEFNDSTWDSTSLPEVENTMCFTGDQSDPEIYFEGIWYRKEVEVPYGGQDIRLVIEGSGYVTDVWAEGLYLGHHEGGYTPMYLPLPENLSERNFITLTIRVDNPAPGTDASMVPDSYLTDEQFNLPYYPYTGISRAIYWQFLPPTQHVAISSFKVVPLTKSGKASLELVINNFGSSALNATLKIEAYKTNPDSEFYFKDSPLTSILDNTTSLSGDKSVELSIGEGEIATRKLEVFVTNAKAWSFDEPTLYVLKASIVDTNGNTLDQNYQQTGFRIIETTEDNRIKFNGSYTYLPAVSYFEDNPQNGSATDWLQTFNDLKKIKELGARMIIADGFTHHSKTYTLADRLGLLVVAQAPFINLTDETYKNQQSRQTALNMFRETVFNHVNHPSIVFWNLCTKCSNSAEKELDLFLSDFTSELAELYPDGRFTMITADYSQIDNNLPASNTYDMLNIRIDDSMSTDELTNWLTGYTAAFEGKSLILTTGKGTGYNDSLLKKQTELANNTWAIASEFAILDKGGKLQKDSFLAGFVWDSMFDHYAMDLTMQSTGTMDMDRFSRKPVNETLENLYGQYSQDSSSSNDSGSTFKPNKVDSKSMCSQSNYESVFLLMILLLLLSLRQRKIYNKR